jgi:uncharacterized protein YeaO (DUF488 family)
MPVMRSASRNPDSPGNPGGYCYGSPRRPGEGLRIGVARHVPRGVRREDRSRLGYFDLWLPLLAPSPELLRDYKHGGLSFEAFARRYRAEMRAPACRQVMVLLAGLARELRFSLGCHCEDPQRCHRSLLREWIAEAMRELPAVEPVPRQRLASPVCLADWEEES